LEGGVGVKTERRIQLLPDDLIDRIAAGEVVERPASVVKELIENSLDSGARSIEVRLRGGGKSAIEVRDDGRGIPAADLPLAVARHATSKISNDRELAEIRTLGFRGEALSSIAAVSRFSITSAVSDGDGSTLSVTGSIVEEPRPVAHPKGTTVVAEQLFLNVPARRKFLRTDQTELSHVARIVSRFALAYPDRRFKLTHGERTMLDVEAVPDLRQRMAQVHGKKTAGRLLEFEMVADGLAIRGLAGRPADGGATRRDVQHLFVNGRLVQDRTLSHAVAQAYGNTMVPGRYPALVAFVDLAAEDVDVNVHPQKSEIRFRDGSRVHELLKAAIGDSLAQYAAIPSLTELRPRALDAHATAIKDATLGYLQDRSSPSVESSFRSRITESQDRSTPSGPGRPIPFTEGPLEEQDAPRYLGQILDSYLIAMDRDGVMLIDQHAAHERVLFERYLEDAEQNRVEVQQLLFPLTLELSPAEATLVEIEAEEFNRLGFRIAPFGDRTVRIDGIPAVVGEVQTEAFFRELLGEAGSASSASSEVAALRRRLITNAACQAAIKINHPLADGAARGLLSDLSRLRSPTTCPHGRPLIFRVTLDEIERAFKRR